MRDSGAIHALVNKKIERGKRDPPRTIRDWMIWRTIRSIPSCPRIENGTSGAGGFRGIHGSRCWTRKQLKTSGVSPELSGSKELEMTPSSPEGAGTHIDIARAIRAPSPGSDLRRLASGSFLTQRGPGRLAPQAVFPAHPGEWGLVRYGPHSQGFTARSNERPIHRRFRTCPASPCPGHWRARRARRPGRWLPYRR